MIRGVAGCTRPGPSPPQVAHRNRGRCALRYHAYLWTSGHHLHGASTGLSGPPSASQTSQSLLGPNDMLFRESE